MRKVDDGEEKREKKEKIKEWWSLRSTNVVASRPPERRPTATPTARAKIQCIRVLTLTQKKRIMKYMNIWHPGVVWMVFESKKFWVNKILTPEKFRPKNSRSTEFGSKIIVCSKKCCVLKILMSKKVWVKQNFCPKKLWSKKIKFWKR